jgi:hypothetical protein
MVVEVVEVETNTGMMLVLGVAQVVVEEDQVGELVVVLGMDIQVVTLMHNIVVVEVEVYPLQEQVEMDTTLVEEMVVL